MKGNYRIPHQSIIRTIVWAASASIAITAYNVMMFAGRKGLPREHPTRILLDSRMADGQILTESMRCQLPRWARRAVGGFIVGIGSLATVGLSLAF